MPDLHNVMQAIPNARLVKPFPSMTGGHFASVSTDTRTLKPGALFFALSGPNFDGATFIKAAQERGAVAVVVDSSAQCPVDLKIPVLMVNDVLHALQLWAKWWRRQWPGHVIAITGSNGKTTVKQMTAAIVAKAIGTEACWATPGNLNNHIGLPLSIAAIDSRHQMAVLELGMNHPGEIALLAEIAQPQVALVNNAQREHQEFMKSVEAVAYENGTVFGSLPDNGVAIFPKDPEHESIWMRQAGNRTAIRFGMVSATGDSNYRGQEVVGEPIANHAQSFPGLRVTYPNGSISHLMLKGVGEHFALNALAAAACAYASGISADMIEIALNNFEPIAGRGAQRALRGGGILVDDSYNANPDSVRAAIDALVTLPNPRALVLGDMGEVGDQEQAFHQEVLCYANQKQLHAIWLTGSAMEAAHSKTGIGHHFAEMERLITDLVAWTGAHQANNLSPSIWIKGSRFMKMERVVAALSEPKNEVTACC